MALTALQVEHAGKPDAKLGAGKHHDEHGLYLEVRKATSKSWTSRMTIGGREVWLGIGPAKDIPLKRARELHAENRRLVAEGIDPREHRKAQQAARAVEAAKAITFEEAAERFIASHEAGWRNPKHRQQWRNSLASYVFPEIGALPVQAVDTAAVVKILQPLWTEKPETASRVRGRIEQILDWSRTMELRTGENPARWKGHLDNLLPAKTKVRAVKNHASVPYRELPALMAELRKRESLSARALEFTILTAARTAEVIEARWSEFDLTTSTWTVPKDRMKAGREHVVPLSKRALEIIREQRGSSTGELTWNCPAPR
jgi:integrase